MDETIEIMADVGGVEMHFDVLPMDHVGLPRSEIIASLQHDIIEQLRPCIEIDIELQRFPLVVRRLRRDAVLRRWLPVPGQQFCEPVDRVRADACDHVGQPLTRLSAAARCDCRSWLRSRNRPNRWNATALASVCRASACIGLFNCRYLERSVAELRQQGTTIDDQRLRRMSPLGWDHVNLTGDYVWSDSPAYDADGLARWRYP